MSKDKNTSPCPTALLLVLYIFLLSCGREHSFASDQGWFPNTAVPPYQQVRAVLPLSPVALGNSLLRAG